MQVYICMYYFYSDFFLVVNFRFAKGFIYLLYFCTCFGTGNRTLQYDDIFRVIFIILKWLLTSIKTLAVDSNVYSCMNNY